MAKISRRAVVRMGVAVAGAGLTVSVLYQLTGTSAPPAKAAPNAARQAAQGTGLDPLTDQETTTAERAAMAGQPTTRARGGRPDVAFVNAIRLEYEGEAAGPRVAVVKLYDYRTDEMVVRHVDLATGRATTTERARGRQPAASTDETRVAVNLLLADPRFGPSLRAQYRKSAGRDLGSADDLHTRALIFTAAQASSAANARDFASCGAHRCFQAFVGMPDGRWVDMRRIVIDMSAQRILVLDPA